VRSGRFLLFLLAVTAGAAAGMAYGWLINPRNPNSSPQQLRSDYRTDYVLMVAEVYRVEKDPSMAAHRLTFLGDQKPLRIVQEAIVSAGDLGYAPSDLRLLLQLVQGLRQQTVKPSTPSPTSGGTP
jgi:hypothetical protein